MAVIAHIDADAFFASVSLIERPELRGRPVMVAGVCSNRGVVTAATYEARAFGVRAGTPVFQARRLCPQGIFLAAEFEKYQEVSRRIFAIIADISPAVEQTSIDEGYADLTGLAMMYRCSYAGIGRLIQQRVKQELKVTVSVGIAASKILAKMASGFRKPEGLTVIKNRQREEFLRQCKVAAIPGIGPKRQEFFEKIVLKTAWDFAALPQAYVQKILGKPGHDLCQELNGISISKVSGNFVLPKSVSKSQTLEDFTGEREVLYGFAVELLMKATAKMRRFGLGARRLSFFLRKKDFQIAQAHSELFESAHEDDRIFIAEMQRLFEEVYCFAVVYRSVGVCLTQLERFRGGQLSLFDRAAVDRDELMKAVDVLNSRYGGRAVTRASVLASHQDVHEGSSESMRSGAKPAKAGLSGG